MRRKCRDSFCVCRSHPNWLEPRAKAILVKALGVEGFKTYYRIVALYAGGDQNGRRN